MADRRRGVPGGGPVIAALGLAVAVIAWRNALWTRHADAGPTAVQWPDMRVHLDTASAAELRLLPGIGPELAQRIVADRVAQGPFGSVDALERVHGVGPATIEGLRSHVVVETTAPEAE